MLLTYKSEFPSKRAIYTYLTTLPVSYHPVSVLLQFCLTQMLKRPCFYFLVPLYGQNCKLRMHATSICLDILRSRAFPLHWLHDSATQNGIYTLCQFRMGYRYIYEERLTGSIKRMHIQMDAHCMKCTLHHPYIYSRLYGKLTGTWHVARFVKGTSTIQQFSPCFISHFKQFHCRIIQCCAIYLYRHIVQV
jgi:hypothetical protein